MSSARAKTEELGCWSCRPPVQGGLQPRAEGFHRARSARADRASPHVCV